MLANPLRKCTPRKIIISAFLMIGILSTLQAQDIKETLFKDANTALLEANEANAEILAPKNYSEAIKLYRQAESDYDRGKNLDDIRKRLRASVAYFHKATEATKLADVTFSLTIKSRADAMDAESAQFAAEYWAEAEKKFSEAAIELEKGDVNDAKKKAGQAENLYRQAELDAIKANYLNETRELLALADKQNVKKRAPRTLKFAADLVQKSEKELDENRYDKDVARDLAQQSKYEAKHAIFLSNKIEAMKKSKKTTEDLLLEAERPLKSIGATMDMVVEFDEGYDKPTGEIISNIQTMQDQVARLTQDLADRDQQISDFKARIAEMEDQMGSIAEEQSALKQQMEAKEEIRRQFATIERMFTRDEAQVFRQKDDVIIRLIGLNFGVGRSTIEPQYFSLLTTVQNAINTFPESMLTIEGHTDSHGSDQQNLKLSEDRAIAVQQYLIANMSSLSPSHIQAVGYGESKPIANNSTREGRTKNRRIDIVIHPNIPELSLDN